MQTKMQTEIPPPCRPTCRPKPNPGSLATGGLRAFSFWEVVKKSVGYEPIWTRNQRTGNRPDRPSGRGEGRLSIQYLGAFKGLFSPYARRSGWSIWSGRKYPVNVEICLYPVHTIVGGQVLRIDLDLPRGERQFRIEKEQYGL